MLEKEVGNEGSEAVPGQYNPPFSFSNSAQQKSHEKESGKGKAHSSPKEVIEKEGEENRKKDLGAI